MKATFVEIRAFTQAVTDFLADVAYAELQIRLMANPSAGVAIPGCGGLRKMRVADAKRGKGKRGGCRIIYLYVPAAKLFYMLDIYGKDEKEDLSSGEKKALQRLAARLAEEAVSAYQRWLRERIT